MGELLKLASHVDGPRLWDRIMYLAQFGATPEGGVDRPALSQTEISARGALIDWGRAIGLTPAVDAIGNLFLKLEGRERSLAPVMAGSHLDSQPTGGKFDGTYGVLAALEALEAILAHGTRPRRGIEVVAWTNEEGSRFAPGMMGSEAFTGRRPLEQILSVADESGTSVGNALLPVLEAQSGVKREPLERPVAAFIEPHIEQGPLLERAGIPVGIVSGIQGTRRFRVDVKGSPAHAGTTPRRERKDALMAALRMIQEVEGICATLEDTLCTVGMLRVEPNAPSVVPARVFFSIDIRQSDNVILNRLGPLVPEAIERNKGPCSVSFSEIAYAPSITFDAGVRERLSRSAERLQIPWMEIFSSAGHDARQLSYVCPTGMLFVPCRGGISHSPDEWADAEDLEAGARVLVETLWALAEDI